MKLIDYWEKPNVFVVGDDDQSIYEFQGARMKNILDFYNRYKNDLKVVVLTDNYRSSQHILDSAKALIDNNQERLVNHINGLSKTLAAAVKRIDEPLNRSQYYNTRHYQAAIVQQIELLQEQGVL